MPPLLMPPPLAEVPEALFPVRVQSMRVNVPTLLMPPPELKLFPPLRVSPWRVRVPAASTRRMRKLGALASRSMMVVAIPAPVMVIALVIIGKPVLLKFAIVPLSIAVSVYVPGSRLMVFSSRSNLRR